MPCSACVAEHAHRLFFMKKETIRISSEDILRHASNEMHMRACIAGSRKQKVKKGKGSYTRKQKHRERMC